MGRTAARVESVCVFCGSSNAAAPNFLAAADELGRALAAAGMRLVYGGGGVGLMGACARAAHEAGGRVLGVMPNFLRAKEILYDVVETIVVDSMHERKQIMFEEADAILVLPGGVGTLEEVVELMSWKRLSLHDKPIVFVDVDGYWRPYFDLIRHTVDHGMTPRAFLASWVSVATPAEAIAHLQSLSVDDDPGLEAQAARLT